MFKVVQSRKNGDSRVAFNKKNGRHTQGNETNMAAAEYFVLGRESSAMIGDFGGNRREKQQRDWPITARCLCHFRTTFGYTTKNR